MDDKYVFIVAAILARKEGCDNWQEVALHDAFTLMDELECHEPQECDFCNPRRINLLPKKEVS